MQKPHEYATCHRHDNADGKDTMINDDTAALLRTLKQVYKKHGLRYSDIALSLEVSEITIKRHMSGKALTLDMLHRLCTAGNISVLELAKLAEQENPQPLSRLDSRQADSLTRDVRLGMTCFLLSHGWTAQQIARDLQLDAATMTGLLTRLDRLGVIALFPGNRVRLLRKMRDTFPRDTMPFRIVSRLTLDFVSKLDLGDPQSCYTQGLMRLSEASRATVDKLLDRLRNEILQLQEHDLDLPADQARWCMLFAVLGPADLNALLDSPHVEQQRTARVPA